MDNFEEMEAEDLELSFFNEIPDELIIKILSYLSPYTDTKQSKLVNRKWYRIITTNELHCRKMFYECLKSSNIKWQIHKQCSYDIVETLLPGNRQRNKFRSKIPLPSANVPPARFSHASVILGQYLYVFSGSASESNFSSTYNDIYRLDLSTRTWQKIKTEGLIPAPRECCSLVAYKKPPSQHLYRTIPYKGKLVIFGGWCHPPRDRIIIGPRFFDDTQLFHIEDSRWERLSLNYSPSPRAGHSASVIGQKMVLIGGSQKTLRLNDVWVFDLETLVWSTPNIRCQKPAERFGHSQFTLNERTILILGGCGGNTNELFGDMWLLDVSQWMWSQVVVKNTLHHAPDLWCHDSVMINGNIVTFSEEKECPYCGHPIQMYRVPESDQNDDPEYCSCGRLNDPVLQISSNRYLQLYFLDCSQVLSKSVCTWSNYQYLSPSPESRRLFTANAGINEIILFGGLQNELSDSSKLDNCIIIVSGKT